MPRPLDKTQLLDASSKEHQKLETFLSGLTPVQMTTPPAPGAWSVKDVLAHLYEWQRMFFTWYETGLRGGTPEVPAPGYKWNQLPAINQAIYERYRDMPLDEVLARFRAAHQKTVQLIGSLTEADLTTPGLYQWMNNNTLMAYFNSTTAAHFVWALKECKKSVRSAGARD